MRYKSLTGAIAMSVGMLTAPLALADLNDGLIAHYPFDGNAQDASGNGNNGTVNGATLTEDRFGNPDSAYHFDGNNDYIEVGNNNNLNFGSTGDFSITAWFKAKPSQLIYPSIVGRRNSGSLNNGYLLFLWTNGRLASQLNSGFYKNYQSTSNDLRDDIWHNATITANRDDGHLIFYVDGVQKGQVDISNIGNIDSISNLLIGWDIGNPSNTYFEGVIDDIRIYNRALSEDEIQALYEGTPNGDCEHATYSLKKRTLTVPFVEMPVIDFLTGQSTGKMELWTGSLRQVLGTTNRFRLLSKTVTQITDGSSSECPATYAVETGTLKIPYIDIPTGIAVGNKKFENGVDVFKATMTWEPLGKSFVVQEVEQLP